MTKNKKGHHIYEFILFSPIKTDEVNKVKNYFGDYYLFADLIQYISEKEDDISVIQMPENQDITENTLNKIKPFTYQTLIVLYNISFLKKIISDKFMIKPDDILINTRVIPYHIEDDQYTDALKVKFKSIVPKLNGIKVELYKDDYVKVLFKNENNENLIIMEDFSYVLAEPKYATLCPVFELKFFDMFIAKGIFYTELSENQILNKNETIMDKDEFINYLKSNQHLISQNGLRKLVSIMNKTKMQNLFVYINYVNKDTYWK